MKQGRPIFSRLTLLPFLFTVLPLFAATPVVHIEIRNHLFEPSEITVPAHVKIRLVITNHDTTSEEFESYELNREKIILGKRKGSLFIGPLEPGVYPFFGEFFPETAVGKIIAK